MPTGRKTILIAEDSEDDIFFIQRGFVKAGLDYQLRFVRNGRQVMDYLSQKAPFEDVKEFPVPALLLLDLKMPVVDGLEVLAWLRGESSLRGLPVLVHSGSELKEDQDQARALGAQGYYFKTANPEETISIFKEIAHRWLRNDGNVLV
ncbi:MAG TPA: response regulator [Candidatus Dormibacteraeota bacterium]|nr:response regulator [Candidatus Dormibacteraeota bacterium]